MDSDLLRMNQRSFLLSSDRKVVLWRFLPSCPQNSRQLVLPSAPLNSAATHTDTLLSFMRGDIFKSHMEESHVSPLVEEEEAAGPLMKVFLLTRHLLFLPSGVATAALSSG